MKSSSPKSAFPRMQEGEIVWLIVGLVVGISWVVVISGYFVCGVWNTIKRRRNPPVPVVTVLVDDGTVSWDTETSEKTDLDR